MISHKKQGIKNFLKRDFKTALIHFSLALQEDIEDKELKTYINLADLAKEREEEAMALFDFYTISLKENSISDEKDLEQIIDSLEVGLDKLHAVFEKKELEAHILEENGITYDDFLALVKQRGSFAKTFEDIMFSTRVLISKKEDFMHFLNLLVENGFTDMALNYLENAVTLFPGDDSLQALANKVEVKQNESRN